MGNIQDFDVQRIEPRFVNVTKTKNSDKDSQQKTIRYDKPDKFFFHEKYEPLPKKGITIICQAPKAYYCEHKNSVDARRGLRAIARKFGGNALLDIHTESCSGTYHYYRCWGIPALYGRKNPKGRFTKEQLENEFIEISQKQSETLAEPKSNIGIALLILVACLFCLVFF